MIYVSTGGFNNHTVEHSIQLLQNFQNIEISGGRYNKEQMRGLTTDGENANRQGRILVKGGKRQGWTFGEKGVNCVVPDCQVPGVIDSIFKPISTPGSKRIRSLTQELSEFFLSPIFTHGYFPLVRQNG